MKNTNNDLTWPGWETVRLIGRGSFGAVYEIERDVFGEKEKAALKVITIPQSSSDIDELYGEGYDDESITSTFKAYLKSIVAEYSLMRKMNGSANAVNCDDVRYVQHDDGIGWDIFIKMELLTPLTKALGKKVSDEQVIRIGTDICKALVLCKKHNIIHRDIKPANIFVSENGDYKLGDFGIAKTVEKTSGGTKIGTYEYMAPEVYHDQPYGSTVDIYSLGMVLYWLLNERRTPFLKMPPALPTNSEKEQARKRRFGGEDIPAPKHGSEALKRIVLKACSYDPKDRYQSAEEMLHALEGLSTPHSAPAYTPVSAGTAMPGGPKSATNEDGLSRAPAPTAEDATVGTYAKPAPVPAEADVSGSLSPPGEEGTVGVFGKPTTASVGGDARGDMSIPEEDATVGVFSSPKPTKPERKTNKPAPVETEKSGKKSPVLGLIGGILALAAILLIVLLPKKAEKTPAENAAANAKDAELSPWMESAWDWSVEDGVLKIRGTGDMENYSSSGLAPWYSQRDKIVRVEIEEGITSIGEYAFYGCTDLTSVSIPNSVTNIGRSAFCGCTGLTSVRIPNSVTSIGWGAFWGCTGLTSVNIPNSVTNIGRSAFHGCTGLTSVSIPDSVTSIGDGAFCECTGLTSVSIPDGVTSIGNDAFYGCTDLTSISIPDSVTSIGRGAFYGCTGLTSVSIPDGVTSIGGYAFYGCHGLTSVSIPDGVTSIGDYAFNGCTGLTSLSIPGSVTSIGRFAFSSCYRLTSVSIPDSVTSIGDYAFNGCNGLTSVNIPNSVTNIGRSAFYGCSALRDIYYGGTEGQWSSIAYAFEDVDAAVHFGANH